MSTLFAEIIRLNSVRMNMTTYIYALVHPETKEIRYIGKSNNPKKRLWEHHQLSRLKSQTHKNNWIKSLLKQGLRAEFIILEECNETNWKEREKFYIKQTPNLTNTVDGGSGEFRKSYAPEITDEIRQKISESIKKRHKQGVFKDSHKKISKACQGKRKKGSLSKYVGVTPVHPNKWGASIKKNLKSFYLGSFETERDAAIAYDHKARELFGPNAKTNFKETFPLPLNSTQKKITSSKYKGVSRSGKKWTACVCHNGGKTHLGTFETEELAYKARCDYLSQ